LNVLKPHLQTTLSTLLHAGGEMLQAIVHQRYKLRRSIVVTSNRVVQDWGKYLVWPTARTCMKVAGLKMSFQNSIECLHGGRATLGM